MTKQQLKEAIEITAKENGMTELEVISQAQDGAANKGDENALEMLCEIKWDYIERTTNALRREGAGRHRMEKGKQTRRNIMLSDRLIAKAQQIGGGNISEGIRRALESFGEC